MVGWCKSARHSSHSYCVYCYHSNGLQCRWSGNVGVATVRSKKRKIMEVFQWILNFTIYLVEWLKEHQIPYAGLRLEIEWDWMFKVRHIHRPFWMKVVALIPHKQCLSSKMKWEQSKAKQREKNQTNSIRFCMCYYNNLWLELRFAEAPPYASNATFDSMLLICEMGCIGLALLAAYAMNAAT